MNLIIRRGLFQNVQCCVLILLMRHGSIFVSENRSGNYEGEAFDFVYGTVVNDDVYTTFTLHTSGTLTKEQTLEDLKVKKLYDQLASSSYVF